jgi:ribulose bisphosphate carboxylase small subunit
MNLDFSFSLKQIPSPDFVQNFRKKYESEFMRLETLDPNYSNHASERIVAGVAHQSSGVSSVYSMNMGRNISLTS